MTPRRERGFTLIELMVTVTIGAILTQLVVFNLGALIPSTLLDSEAKSLLANYDFLRSEARLHGKPYKLQIDLTRGRWRMVLPPEDRVLSLQDPPKEFELNWQSLDERVKFGTYATAGGRPATQGLVDIVIDENGFSADQTVSFKLKELEDYVWTVQIHGLTGATSLKRSLDKKEVYLDAINEGHF